MEGQYLLLRVEEETAHVVGRAPFCAFAGCILLLEPHFWKGIM